MTGRARVRAALAHESTDRIPIALVCSGINQPTRDEFDTFLRETRGVSLDRFLFDTIDIVTVAPVYQGPELGPMEDIWGVVRRPVAQTLGSYDEIDVYPLADATSTTDLDRHRWPDPDWFDYGAVAEQIDSVLDRRERAIMVTNGNIFESSWYMRGFETMLADLALNPELAHTIIDRVTSFYLEFFSRLLEAGQGEIDLVFTADDLGGQHGQLISRGMWETFIKPHHMLLNRVIHDGGAKVMYHTDGAVAELVDGLVAMGIDVLQALQFDADGMEPSDLKARFGSSLCFEGGVSVQRTLPQLGPDDVRSEVRELISILGVEGGYILGPSHAIQAGTPVENIAAMFDEALSYYPF